MNYSVITLFPEIINSCCSESIIGRAVKNGIISIKTINPRDFSKNKHKKVDDTPYGGGAGMVLMCQPFYDAYEAAAAEYNLCSDHCSEDFAGIIFTPQGKVFNQRMAQELSAKKNIVMICGHYEGFDERIRQIPRLMEISIGDFVITGGEMAALCLIDAVSRLIPGCLGKQESAEYDSFSNGLLEYPHYTRPYEYRGMKVPEILLSGNHQEISKWRKAQSLLRTKEKRPDLFEKIQNTLD